MEPVKSEADVAGYASKYVMKLPCWWNVKIRWHRLQSLHGVVLSLEREPDSLPATPLPVPLPFPIVEDQPVDLVPASTGGMSWTRGEDGCFHPGVWCGSRRRAARSLSCGWLVPASGTASQHGS